MTENRAKYENEVEELSIGDLMKLAKANRLFLCKIEKRVKKLEDKDNFLGMDLSKLKVGGTD